MKGEVNIINKILLIIICQSVEINPVISGSSTETNLYNIYTTK